MIWTLTGLKNNIIVFLNVRDLGLQDWMGTHRQDRVNQMCFIFTSSKVNICVSSFDFNALGQDTPSIQPWVSPGKCSLLLSGQHFSVCGSMQVQVEVFRAVLLNLPQAETL